MPRIRVLEVGKSTAGVGAYLRYLADGLDRKKFHLTFACLSDGSNDLADELRRLSDTDAVSWPMNRFKIDIIGDLLVVIRLARLIRNGDFDLIHAHASKAGFLTRVAAMGSGVPVIYSPHCFSFHDGVSRFQAMVFAMLESFAAQFLTTRIITVADGEQELARKYGVGSPHQFITVRNGINVDAYQKPVNRDQVKSSLKIPVGSPLVGAVGRLGKQKDPLTFIRMAKIVHDHNADVHFVWVGAGPLMQAAKECAHDLKIQDYVHFVGEQKDVASILKTMDCFVLTSLWEGLSIVLLEAMATGLPIVSTDIPGNAEVITNGKTGLLAPVKDADSLATGVVYILKNPDKARSMSRAAYEHVFRNFSFHQMIAAVERIYSEVCNETNI